MSRLDTAFVRTQFPAFSIPSLEDWTHFEAAGGSYASRQTIELLDRFYRETKVQPFGAYPASQKAGDAMEAARKSLADWLNITPDEVHFGPSTSANSYVLAQAVRGILSPGDEIVVTDQDHEANSGVWRHLEGTGCIIREWQADTESGLLDLEKLKSLLNNKTRLVCFPHASNIVGAPNPAAQIATMAREVGAITVADGVSFAPHGLPDIRVLAVDIYLFSLYKTYGPHQGVMTLSRDLAERLTNQGHYFNAAVVDKRLTPAGPDHAQIAAAKGVTDYFEALYQHHFGGQTNTYEKARLIRNLLNEHESRLLVPLLDWAKACRKVRILGPDNANERVPTLSLHCKRKNAKELAVALSKHKVMAGSGYFYAPRILERMGVPPEPGVLRLSFTHYMDDNGIARLIDSLEQELR